MRHPLTLAQSVRGPALRNHLQSETLGRFRFGLNATRGGSTSFAVGTISPTTLAPGASLAFTVTFSSDSGLFGLRSDSLQIASNDGDENPFNIALSGMKVAPDIEIEQPAGTVLVDGNSTVDFGIVPAATQLS